jgi:hypothetical protein
LRMRPPRLDTSASVEDGPGLSIVRVSKDPHAGFAPLSMVPLRARG